MKKKRILAGVCSLFLSGCVHEVQLTPLSREEHVEALPLSAKIEISESVSSGKVPIVFDLKPAAAGYFRNRGTFREVVESGADVVLKIRSRLVVTAPVNFTYAFELQGSLQGGGKILGAYRVQCSAEGGQIRL
ncbi:MAG TPA: hypothetical protein VM029_00605, partial [Opitutaceae bacterium]|nr:hypothetical protein [Opitutaceae bacterium]